MIKKTLILFTLVMLVMINRSAFAQDLPTGKWWKDPDVIKKLNLNEKKVDQLDDLFSRSFNIFGDLRNKVSSAQIELKALLEGEDFDEGAVMNKVAELEKERSALNIERIRVLVKIRQIIGYEAFIRMSDAAEKIIKERNLHRRNEPNGNINQPSPKSPTIEKGKK